MLTKIELLKGELNKIQGVNQERLNQIQQKEVELDRLFNQRETLREEYTLLQFVTRASSEYYKLAREGNLQQLGLRVGEFMGRVLSKDDYVVELNIKRKGNYDYLDILVNGLEPRNLSGGEKQVFSLAMVSECTSNGVLVLDETINSLDPYSLDKILEYLEDIAKTKQVFMIELDDNLDLPYTFMTENNTIIRGNNIR